MLGVAFRVHTALGPSLKEEYYRRALAHGLRKEGFRVETERRMDVTFDDLVFRGALKMDIVDNTILIEVKARDVPLAVWNAQVWSYLRRSDLPLGYLVNFHVPRLRNGIRPFAKLPLDPAPPVSIPPSSSTS